MKLAIIFDFDGVIVDSLEAWSNAFFSVCRQNGYGQIATKEKFLEMFEGNLYETLEKSGIKKDIISFMRDKLEKAYSNRKKEIKMFEGIKEMLENLLKEHKVYIVSSNFSDIVERYLKSKSIEVMGKILGADRGRSKVKKIESIKTKLPDYVLLYVGDTKGDMVEGKLAGVKTVAVAWGWHSEKRLREGKPDFLIKNPEELVSLSKRLSEK